MNKQDKEKVILAVVIGLVGVVAFFYIVLKPVMNKISGLKGDILVMEEKIHAAEHEITDIEKTKDNLKKIGKKIKKYSDNTPQDTPDWLLNRLNTLAENNGIIFNKIEPKGYIYELDDYKLQGLFIELKSDYHRFGKFINEFETMSPFLRVVDIDISRNEKDAATHIVKVTVGAYVKQDKKIKT